MATIVSNPNRLMNVWIFLVMALKAITQTECFRKQTVLIHYIT